MKYIALVFIVLAFTAGVDHAYAQGTAFTYQGELTYNGALANGIFDLRFTILDASSGGGALAGPVTRNAVAISNGVFTVLLDFGAGVFTGAGRWVEIDARANGGTFSTLAPRQPLTPAPYAITAARVVSGGIPTGTYASAVTFNNTSNSFNGAFTGNGTGLTGITSTAIGSGQVVKSLNGLNDAVTLSAGANITLTPSGNNIQIAASGGGGGSSGWSLTGNVGTVAGANFLGTTDNQPLELRVSGARALRLEPNTNGGPNVIGGSPINAVDAGVVGATIGGGGATNYFGFAYTNRVAANFGTIGGGLDNTIGTTAGDSTIGGGGRNTIVASFASTIGGGFRNTIQTNSPNSTIGGGQNNTIQTNADASTIGGGFGHLIQPGADSSTIGGGSDNRISTGALLSTISGGEQNTIAANSIDATIAGGADNNIGTNSSFSAIGGGTNNSIAANSRDATIAGGSGNDIGTNSFSSAIGGGRNNSIVRSSESTIAGGVSNGIEASSSGSTIGGGFHNTIAANSIDATIAGGSGNTIFPNSLYSVIGGGSDNTIAANSPYATIPGGFANAATHFAFAAGTRAKAIHTGSFVWADSTDADFATTRTNQFLIRASGNVGIGTNNPSQKLHVIGNILASGTITPNSDRNAKTEFEPVDTAAILQRVAALPIQRWRFKAEDPGVKHVGPMAQDFHAAFGLGAIPTAISTVDADGVALAAIQALNQKLEGKDAEIQELKKAVGELKALVNALTGEQK